MPDKPQTLYLIDGHALLYRSYHAIKAGSMLALDRKTPTNAVFGFAMEIRKLRTRFKPDCVAAVFDPHGPVLREARYNDYAAQLGPAFSGYKSHRDAMPDDLRPQIDIALELCVGYGIPSFQLDGHEADDVLATLAITALKHGVHSVIVTGDKDLMQLVQPGISIYDPLKDIFFDEETVVSVKGVKPSQIIDWLGFQGDAVDNIPGVAGVGGQTAVKLLSEHGSMDAALAHYREKLAHLEAEILDFVTQHEAEALKENKAERKALKPPKGIKVVEAYLFAQGDRARASRELARLDMAVPLEFKLEAMRLLPPEASRLAPLLKRLDFKSFLRDLDPQSLAQFEASATASDAASPNGAEAAQGPVPPKTVCAVIDSPLKLKALAAELSEQTQVALLVQSTEGCARGAEIEALTLCFKTGEAHYIPVRAQMGAPVLDIKLVLAELRPALENPSLKKIGHDLKRAVQVLRNDGVRLAGEFFDTRVAAWLLEPSTQNLKIRELALNHCHLRDDAPPATESMFGSDDPGREECVSADCVFRLAKVFGPKLLEAGLEPLMRDIEMPLIGVLAQMEWIGVRVDAEFLRAMSGKLEIQLAAQETQIHEAAGGKFNISSPKQLGVVLFEKLGLVSKSNTATGQASTSEEVLLLLSKEHELPKKVLEYRGAMKLKNTYVDALPKMILPATGRIHACFNQTGTETGRISSNDPNIQNIPVRSELGRTIRAAFTSGHAGWKILSADYSQIELRILAHYSEDKNLLDAFARGLDIHTAVAANLNGITESDVTHEQRSQAKAVNFGIIYGQTAFGLAATIGVPRRQAQMIIDAYFERHPGVKKCIAEIIASAQSYGYVTTILGRRRFIPQLKASDRGARGLGERLAVNTVFQGSAADLIKKAMIEIDAALDAGKFKARMLLQIHDELLFETPAEEVERVSTLVKTKMEGALKLNVPLVVEVGAGNNWLEAK